MLTFPFTSVTVRITVFGPTSVHVKVESDTSMLAIPQLSKLPLLIDKADVLALPFASNWIVTSWQFAVGAILSSTVTTAEHVLTFPFTSVTVRITVFGPTSVHVKVESDTSMLAMPQLSNQPLLIDKADVLALPFASN